MIRRRKGVRSRLPKGLGRFGEQVEAADALWSQIIRSRTQLCQRCGYKPGTDAHHLVSRRYKQTRWLLDTGAHLCRGCHHLVGMDGEENRALAVKLVGAERWDQLNIAKNCRAKVDPLQAQIVLHAIAAGVTSVGR